MDCSHCPKHCYSILTYYELNRDVIFLVPIFTKLCSLVVSVLDSPAVEPRSNPGSGKILMCENLRLYTTSPVVMYY